MILNISPIVATMCLNFSGPGNTACNSLLARISDETKTTATLSLLESEARKDIENNVKKEILYSLIATSWMIDSYNKKTLIFQIPITKELEVSTNITYNSDNYGIKWTRKF